MARTSPLLLLALLPLAACDGGDADQGPGGVSASEARELNEAAEMLADDSVSENALANETIAP
jgi:hypothetical protein